MLRVVCSCFSLGEKREAILGNRGINAFRGLRNAKMFGRDEEIQTLAFKVFGASALSTSEICIKRRYVLLLLSFKGNIIKYYPAASRFLIE